MDKKSLKLHRYKIIENIPLCECCEMVRLISYKSRKRKLCAKCYDKEINWNFD